jgi:hypothetical protein
LYFFLVDNDIYFPLCSSLLTLSPACDMATVYLMSFIHGIDRLSGNYPIKTGGSILIGV